MNRLAIFSGLLVLTTIGCSRGKTGDGGAGTGSSPVTGSSPSTGLGGGDGGIGTEILSGLNVNAATGHVESTGATGAWQLDRGTCYSGDNDGFYGIFVKSKADKRVWVKLVKDPLKGWNVGVSIPDTCKAGANGQQCEVEYFDAKECATLDVGLQAYTFKGRRTAGGHQFDGDVTFDCTARKAHVAGKLTIEKCSP